MSRTEIGILQWPNQSAYFAKFLDLKISPESFSNISKKSYAYNLPIFFTKTSARGALTVKKEKLTNIVVVNILRYERPQNRLQESAFNQSPLILI